MAACTENTSLFLVVDMPKVKLEVIAETEEGDETSLLSSVLEKGCTNSNGGKESVQNGVRDAGIMKVRNNLTHKKGRKLPSLSFSPSPGGSSEEENIQKNQPVRRVVTSPKILSSNHGDHSVTPSGSTEDETLNTLQSSQERASFQKKKQLFERGEGALLARRALTRRPSTRRNGRRRLPKVPHRSVDPIDQVLEANRVHTLESDLEESENNTSGISSLDSSSGPVEDKDFKRDHSDEPNEWLILSGSAQTAKKVANVKPHKYRKTSNEESEDTVNGVDLLQIKSNSSFSDVSSDSNYTSIEVPISGLYNDSTTLNETGKIGLQKQFEDYEEHHFPKEVGHTLQTGSEVSQQAQNIEGPPQLSPDNNLVHSRSQREFEVHNHSGEYSEGVAFDESEMGDGLAQRTVHKNTTDHIRKNTQAAEEEEEENKPLQHLVNSLSDFNTKNTHINGNEHDLPLDGREHPPLKRDSDSQPMDPKVSDDTLYTLKSDSELVESPKGDKQLFQLLLDDYEDDFHTDDEESKLEEQDSGEQQNINNSSEIKNKHQVEEHFQRKLVRNDAIDEYDADMTAESTAGEWRMETTQIESNDINEESKINNSFNHKQPSLQGDVNTAGSLKSEMEFNSKNDEAYRKDDDIRANYSMQKNGDEAETYRPDGESELDLSTNYHEHSSLKNDQKGMSASQEMLGQNTLDAEGNINRNTSSKLDDKNSEAMSNLQANQNNGDPRLGGRTMSENTEICDSEKPGIIVHSKPPPTEGNSSVVQNIQNNLSGNEMKINTAEEMVHGSKPVTISNEEKDKEAINGGGDIKQQKDRHNQSSISKNKNEIHQIISSQATSNSELEPNILVEKQTSLGEEPSSEQTLISIKSLGNGECELDDDINDTQDEIQNKTVVTSADPKSSLTQEALLGKNHPNSQKLIKVSEREEAEGGDGMIKRQVDERQMKEQQNGQRKKSDEDLSHSLPGDDNQQTRDVTLLVNKQLKVKSNATEERRNYHATTNHEDESYMREHDGYEMEEPENNNGTNVEPGSNGKMIAQPFQTGLLNEKINDSTELGIFPENISQNDMELKPSKVVSSENVTQENLNYENQAQNKTALDDKNHQLESDRKTENLPQEKQQAKKEQEDNFRISMQGHQISKVSYSDISSNGQNESVLQKSALRGRQVPTDNNVGVGKSDIEGPIPSNNIHNTNGNSQEISKNSSVSGGHGDNTIDKENVNKVSHNEFKGTESLPRKSALKVRQVSTGNNHHQNAEAVGNNDMVTEGPIATNDNISGTNGNMQEPSQHSDISGGHENTIIRKVSKVSENDQRQSITAADSVPRKSALRVRQVPTGDDNIQSTKAVGNGAMVNEGLITTNNNINDSNRSLQEPLKHSNIPSGPGENSFTKEKVSVGNENGTKIKIHPKKQDQAAVKVIKGDGAFVQPQRHPDVVDQKKGKENGTNRHEGHNCPRELRRLARLKETEEQATEGSQNQSSHWVPDNTGTSSAGAVVTGENPPVTSRQTFPGQGSEEAANSELIQTPTSPSSKKRRRKKPADPFDGLPPIKPWHLHQLEMNAEIMERPKKKKKGQRRFNISQFDDPFHQMVWVLFRAADRDTNNKLNKKELSSILNSPKLQLSLTQDDIKRLLKESSTEEQADPKTCELSFEEFIPLGRLILMLYYSKTDDSSQSKWCILDKGQDYGIIYFNKLTGDASISVPSDYYADVLHEPDLLDIAIHDLFEDADLNEDGKINLTDFLRILRSEDFGLFLTNGDVEEIMKYFVNVRGKEMMVQFDEFLPLAKRLILTVYRARDPTPANPDALIDFLGIYTLLEEHRDLHSMSFHKALQHEWCHLYTRNVGSFWFNKRTGQADRHPPTSLVRTLQDLLEHRSREIEVFMEVAEDLHHTKEALQTETEKRQELETKLTEVAKQHETTTKELAKTVTNLEKSKEEVEQKSKQIRFFEKEKLKQQNLIESLQDRAEEADRIEANLESLRNVLQNTQTSVREKEFDVRDLTSTLDETRKELASTKQHSASLQDKIDDLVVQLRDEIRRNERVEKELERTKSYKFEKVEVEDILKETKDELEMRMNQLTHARYEIRDNKSRIRRIETELNSVPDLKTQLEEKEQEIKTLKEKIEKLEAQMIEDARLADKYPRELVRRRRWNKARSIETPDKSHDCSDPNCPVNGRTSALSNPMWAYKNNEETQAHTNGSFLELLSNIEGEDGSDSLNIYDFYEPHYHEVSPHRVRIDSASAPNRRERSRLVRPKSSAGRLETKKQSKLGRGVFLYEEDYLLARFVKEGDRVRIKKAGVNVLGMKPSDLRTATVRYVGQLDEEGAEHMLFVGLHMDDAVGDTNGIIDDKRYFYSKRRHGKMVRITEILYLLNPKTTSFDKISDLVEEYKASRRKRWRDYPEEGPRLIRVT